MGGGDGGGNEDGFESEILKLQGPAIVVKLQIWPVILDSPSRLSVVLRRFFFF